MRTHRYLICCLGLGLTSVALADDKDERIEALEAEVAELKATVGELRDMQQADDEQWLTEQRAEQIRGIVADVLADADTRASLLQQGATAGWDKNFFLQSADGNWRLRIRGQIQVRFNASFQNDSPDGEDSRYGTEIRRAKLKLDGHIVNPTWGYVLNLAVDHDDSGSQGELDLEDAIITKDFENGFELWAGQFKRNFLREELVSSTDQLAVERSLINETFNQDRSQAVAGEYTGDMFRVSGAIGTGFGDKNDEAYQADAWGITVRADWLAMGNWKQFNDFTSVPDQDPGVMVGGAFHYNKDKYSPKTEFTTWTIDASAEFSAFTLFGYFVARYLDPAAGSTQDQYGVVIQGGYYFTEDIEGFARYEWGDLDEGPDDELSLLTVGVNYYLAGKAVKWTSDIGVAFTNVPAGFASANSTGWREDDPNEDGQVVIRSQLQLLF